MEPNGRVIFPDHEVLLDVAANCLYVSPPSNEYQIEVLAARVPDSVTEPVAVGSVAVTVGTATTGAA